MPSIEATAAAAFAHLGVPDVEFNRPPKPEKADRYVVFNQMVLQALAVLSDADLSRPYDSFQPNDSGPEHDLPVLRWIRGNTNEHADEHAGYIRELIGS